MKVYLLAILAKVSELSKYASIGAELAVRLIKCGVRSSQDKIKTRLRKMMSRFGSGFNDNLRICKALWIGLIRRGRRGEVK